MTDLPILRDLGFILVAAAAFGLAGRRFRIPPIVAYMLAGLVLGPITGLVPATAAVDLMAEAGIALLLFVVGLELSLDKVRGVGRAALLAGGSQMVLTAAVGFGLARLLGYGPIEASLLGLALTFSSTVVVVKLLEERREFDTPHGRIAVGILLVQDVAVAIALTLLAGLGDGGAVGAAALVSGTVAAFTGLALLVAAAWVLGRQVLPPLYRWLAESSEAVFVLSLAWAFLFIVAAEALGLSIEIGAFVAGVALAQLPQNQGLVLRVHPLANFFLAVFFVALGIHMEPAAALAQWRAGIVLTLLVLIGKPVVLMAILPRLGYGERTSFLGALSLGQVSEFSFVVAALGFGAGLFGQEVLALLSAVGLVTIAGSAGLLAGADRVHAAARRSGLLRPFGARASEPAVKEDVLEDHVIVVGMNALGRRLVQALAARGERVVAIDSDPAKLAGLPCLALRGNAEQAAILEQAGLARARLLVSALQIEDSNQLLAWRASRAGVPSSIHAFDPSLAPELRDLGATHLMVSKHDGIRQLAESVRATGVIEG